MQSHGRDRGQHPDLWPQGHAKWWHKAVVVIGVIVIYAIDWYERWERTRVPPKEKP